MTRKEMIEIARETRKHVTNAVVPPELTARYPVQIACRNIPTRVGDAQVFDITGDNVRSGGPLLIHFHGGGFIRERTKNDELYCRRLVHGTGCRVWDVDYRLAPEFPYPTALHECCDVVRWAFEHATELEVDPKRIGLVGHSAGGNLVCGICMAMLREKTAMPALAAVEYPPLDLAMDPAQKRRGKMSIPVERARLYNLFYCDPNDLLDPFVSPCLATTEQLSGFPPLLVVTAGEDDLCEEGEQFALHVAQAGGEVTLKRYPTAGHGFTVYRNGPFEEATELVLRFLRETLQVS